MTTALSTTSLTKYYGEIAAVRDVSLTVPAGALFGLVGANGAGKTTFLSMATGLLRPSTGTATIDGVDVWADPTAARGRIGLLPDGPTMSEALPGLAGLRYVGVLQGLAPDVADGRARQLLDVFGQELVDHQHPTAGAAREAVRHGRPRAVVAAEGVTDADEEHAHRFASAITPPSAPISCTCSGIRPWACVEQLKHGS